MLLRPLLARKFAGFFKWPTGTATPEAFLIRKPADDNLFFY